jgi:SpoVK/Ycf46/Vps4 family AAA+-type ATPase
MSVPVDLSSIYYEYYKRSRKFAEESEKSGNFEKAISAHRLSAEWMRKYIETLEDKGAKEKFLQIVERHEKTANQLEQSLSSNNSKVQNKFKELSERSDESGYEAVVLNLIEKSNVQWNQIGGLEDTKAAIKEAYGMALARKPKGINIQNWRNFLFFGPPGTGKTSLAAATASNLDATFFNVKVSSLVSKYFGESTKLISKLYSLARSHSPSVIFLDDFESLIPRRDSADSGAERRIVSTFLAELDGLEGKNDESFVLTIGATNLPWLLDDAILSRFQKRIYVPLPDAAARKAILEIHLTKRGHKLNTSIPNLVEKTTDFSGRDIEQLCLIAITRMAQRLNPELIEVVDQGKAAIKNYEITVGPILDEDFDFAFSQANTKISSELIHRYEKWKNN